MDKLQVNIQIICYLISNVKKFQPKITENILKFNIYLLKAS